MDARTLRTRGLRAVAVLAAVAGLSALLLLARSVENSADFSRSLPWILLGNIFAVVVLAVLLARKLWQLWRDFRDHVPGSRLTARTVAMIGGLVVAPLLVVYLFSLEFLNRGIDSWFQVEIRQGLNDALVLSRSALDLRMREQARRTESIARQITSLQGRELLQTLDEERRSMEAAEIIVYEASGRPLAISSSSPTPMLPGVPPTDVLLQIAAERSYVSLQRLSGGHYTITTAAPVLRSIGTPGGRYVLVNYDVPSELAGLSEAVQDSYTQYGNLADMRQPLKVNFRLALTLVLLLTMLAAIYGAIFSAQRLTRPVQDLIAGTRAVGKGDFGTRLPLPSRDEMGFLVHSFNDMTKRLRRASEDAAASQQAVERERERLAVILSRLSSGVLVVDGELQLQSANPSAGAILGNDLEAAVGQNLAAVPEATPRLTQFVAELRDRLRQGRQEWREQLNLPGEAGSRVLLWACTPLPDDGKQGGLVIVFEEITELLTAQRNAAWGEVARRLAHEIKNPLTPIQLSAERLRRKLRTGLSTENAQLLDRATHTIVQQVDAMQQMVNAFSEYARSPDMQVTRFSLNQLISEVADLYRLQDPAAEIRLDLAAKLGEIEADRGRVRQLLANLVSNAIHAVAGAEHGRVEISTRIVGAPASQVQLTISDNGPGFQEDLLQRAFEPYVTSKARGMGLGLAIVKRIVEEHAGQIEVENQDTGGARIRVLLPLAVERRSEPRRERA